MANRFQLSYTNLVAVIVLLIALPSISADNNISPDPSSPRSSDEEFFHKSCNITPYPDVCNSMVPMVSPSAIKQSPFQMVKSIVEVSRISSLSTAMLFGDMDVQVRSKKNLSLDKQNLLDVVKGCSSSFMTIVDLKSRAIKQMDQLKNPTTSSDCKDEMKNVETWLFDAIKEEGKCTASIMQKFNEALVKTNMETKITSNAHTLTKDFLANH